VTRPEGNTSSRSRHSIRIEGAFNGEIDTDDELQIASEATVDATVRARTVTVAGQLNGRIECLERLEVLPSGRVTGQIEAGRFVVHEGAFLGGQVRMKAGAATNDEDPQRSVLQRVR
jgi:cytoskeletal protein CcmA (bactofilin family)